MIVAHITHVNNGMLTRCTLYEAPRLGDEIRLNIDEYYKVIKVVWCYDEPSAIGERVNIGVEDIDDKESVESMK